MDWNKITSRRTPVRTKDDVRFGYVAAQWKDNLVIVMGKRISREYIIPKDKFEKYNGIELFMRIRAEEINSDYQI
ncbi:MAG: hypothetical protein ACM3JQ_02395 [Candidatus Eiseniibacteriota bacterium]